MMKTVCNNKMCPHGKRDKPCQVGCIKNGEANICPPNIEHCEFKPCPDVEPTPVPKYHCNGG